MGRNKRAAVFLDRDGVINVSPGEGGFVTQWNDFRFLPGALQALRLFKNRRRLVFVISNQSAVGRGLLSRARLRELSRKMEAAVFKAGGRITAAYYCPHHPKDECGCRKPAPGLLRRAARKFPVDLGRSFVIGDEEKDIQMGRRAGCRTLLVLSGKQNSSSSKRMKARPDRVEKNLLHAARWIVSQS